MKHVIPECGHECVRPIGISVKTEIKYLIGEV